MSLRRSRRVALLFAAAVPVGLGTFPAAVSAEGFFSRLFGWGRSRPIETPIAPPVYRFGYGGQPYDDGAGIGEPAWPRDYGRYRTLCVRTCDGFYFPIGDNVGRERLYADARTCQARCDGEARLYYYPTNGGSPQTMVDLAGRPYAQSPTAFLYRKRLVEGCTCRPAPWSAEAAARHRGYADDERAIAAMRQSNPYGGDVQTGSVRGGDTIGAYLQREDYADDPAPWRRGPEVRRN